MLSDAADDFAARLPRVSSTADNGQVVALGGATGDDNIIPNRAQFDGDGLNGFMNQSCNASSTFVRDASRIGEVILHQLQHDSDDSRVDRRGRLVIQVDHVAP